MPKAVPPSYTIVLATAARRDIINILKRSESEFGIDAAERYESLLLQALRDIEIDPERPGSKERPELGKGAHTYHLQFSRERARIDIGVVQSPRHFLLYRRTDERTIKVARILHDSRDLQRHIPEDYRRDETK